MTRQEIRERAVEIQRVLSDPFDIPSPASVTIFEHHLLAAIRATLEEAARAVCVGCDSTDKIFNDGVAWMHRDESPGYEGPYYHCQATKIHDLIAALDGPDGEGGET